MYGKSYEAKFEGSMVGAGIAVFAVWDYMTTKARDGYVEVNPDLLAFTLGGRDQDPQEIVEALEFLQQPDPKSRSKIEDGRRIVKEGEYQYRLVNWAEYNKIRTEEERREYNRVKQKEFRDRVREAKRRKPSQPATGEMAHKRGVEAGTIDAVTGLPVKPESNGESAPDGVL